MAAIRIHGRQVEIAGTGITLGMFGFSPFAKNNDSGTKTLPDGSSVLLGKPYVVEVEIPGDKQVEDIGFGYQAIPEDDGSHISAHEVMIRIAKGDEGYRVITVTESPET